MGSGDSGSASDPNADRRRAQRWATFSLPRALLQVLRGLARNVSPGGTILRQKRSSGEPPSRISAGHRRFNGVELRGFEPRTFSLRRRVRPHRSPVYALHELRADRRGAPVSSLEGTGGNAM